MHGQQGSHVGPAVVLPFHSPFSNHKPECSHAGHRKVTAKPLRLDQHSSVIIAKKGDAHGSKKMRMLAAVVAVSVCLCLASYQTPCLSGPSWRCLPAEASRQGLHWTLPFSFASRLLLATSDTSVATGLRGIQRQTHLNMPSQGVMPMTGRHCPIHSD